MKEVQAHIKEKKIQTNEMKLTATYQPCDHGSSLVPVTAKKERNGK